MMLSRIARGLYELGRYVERAQNVMRILEVNHKMNLERSSIDEPNVWAAVSESFECALDHPGESDLYAELVLSSRHPYSVRHCVESARDEGRAMRDHISEEMWFHLNREHLNLANVSFGDILSIGRSEFNRQIEVYGDAFYGLAEHTMIRGESSSFLQIGKLLERASMICRILEIKRKTLSLSPESEGAPLDVHQWQALLRSLSGYEPYRRAYDARIVPERVLEFVLKRPDFPRSLICSLVGLREALNGVTRSNAAQLRLQDEVTDFIEVLRRIEPSELVGSSSFEIEVHGLSYRCRELSEGLELGYFTSLRPESAPISPAPGAGLVPQ